MSAKDKKAGIKSASLVISYEPGKPRPWVVRDMTKTTDNVRFANTPEEVAMVVQSKCERWLQTGRVTA